MFHYYVMVAQKRGRIPVDGGNSGFQVLVSGVLGFEVKRALLERLETTGELTQLAN